MGSGIAERREPDFQVIEQEFSQEVEAGSKSAGEWIAPENAGMLHYSFQAHTV